MLVGYFSGQRKKKKELVEHLKYFQIRSATSDVLPNAVNEAIRDCSRDNLLCFHSDGPSVMKSAQIQLKEHFLTAALDIWECLLHKVHHAFQHVLAAFGGDVEAALVDSYRIFRNSASN